MYHYPTVTYSQLVAASVILPPRIPPRRGLGALRPQRSISILITFIIIYQKAASDIRSRTVSILETDSKLRFMRAVEYGPHIQPRKPFSVYVIRQYYKFLDASSLPAENGTPRYLYFKSFLKNIVKINKKMKPTAIF